MPRDGLRSRSDRSVRPTGGRNGPGTAGISQHSVKFQSQEQVSREIILRSLKYGGFREFKVEIRPGRGGQSQLTGLANPAIADRQMTGDQCSGLTAPPSQSRIGAARARVPPKWLQHCRAAKLLARHAHSFNWHCVLAKCNKQSSSSRQAPHASPRGRTA